MRPKNAFMLVLTAFIWGTAFVAQSVGMDFLEPFTFNGMRSLIGGVALLPCIFFLKRFQPKNGNDAGGGEGNPAGSKKDLILGGVACGFFLFAGASSRSALYIRRQGKQGLSHPVILLSYLYWGFFFIRKSVGKCGWQ